MRRVHIIAGCTDRKALTPALRLRQVSSRLPVEDRAKRWWARLAALESPACPAIDLYQGDYWSIVRSLPGIASAEGYEARSWVISAGYGLIPAQTPVRAYSATFAYGHEDSVGDAAAALEAWWEAISENVLPGTAEPRNFKALMLERRSDVFLVIGSPNYLKAVESDLLGGLDARGSRRRLLIVSSAKSLRGTALEPFLVPSEAEFRGALGGALVSLHARVARHVVSQARAHGFDLEGVRSMCTELRRSIGKCRPIPSRVRQSDDAIRAFIRAERKLDPLVAYTPLLRKLRMAGLACEMRRFKQFYAAQSKG
jgi:hypothetical protein